MVKKCTRTSSFACDELHGGFHSIKGDPPIKAGAFRRVFSVCVGMCGPSACSGCWAGHGAPGCAKFPTILQSNLVMNAAITERTVRCYKYV